MFTTATAPMRQVHREAWMSKKAVRLAALLGALVLMSVTVNTLTYGS